MKIESLNFTINDNDYGLTGCESVNGGYDWVHNVKNDTNGVRKNMTLVKLEQIFKKYDAKFVY